MYPFSTRFVFSLVSTTCLLVFVVCGSIAAAKADGARIPSLGLQLSAVTPEVMRRDNLSAASGLRITEVRDGSPAASSGFRIGDIIVEFNEIPVRSVDDFRKIHGALADDGRLNLVVLRGDRPISLAIRMPLVKRLDDDVSQFRKRSAPEASAYQKVEVFYATDRNKAGDNEKGPSYGVDRGDLVYGRCVVTIPSGHQIGELEEPSWLRLEFSEDPSKHVILAGVEETDRKSFYQLLSAHGSRKTALLFVHGYNVTFEQAARRTGQMAYDLRFAGTPLFFSWPSQGSYIGYPVDESNVEFARAHLKELISGLAEQPTVEQLFLVAHSMGTRALTAALVELYRENPELKTKIKAVVLAAPDIDADVFKRDIAPKIGSDTTLYASSNDWALMASKKWHGYPRAGESGPNLLIASGIVTVDASVATTDFFGHSYFAKAKSIVSDIASIIAGKRSPDVREHLETVRTDGGQYWRIGNSNSP